jgi:YHS domain-containing protein
MRRTTTRGRGAILLAVLALSTATAAAVDPVNHTWRGIAIEGYDPVAYFEDGAPREGSAEFEHAWNGATWRFASAAHRDAFAADPSRYAPQFGGYCAWAVSEGATAGIDPDAWAIVDGKLYLNYSKKIQARWEAERDARIERGHALWPEILAGKR